IHWTPASVPHVPPLITELFNTHTFSTTLQGRGCSTSSLTASLNPQAVITPRPASARSQKRRRARNQHQTARTPAVATRASRPKSATDATAEARAEPSAKPATAVKSRSRTGYVARAKAAGTATAASSAGHGTGRDEDRRGVESGRVGDSWVMKSTLWTRFGLRICHGDRLVYANGHTGEVSRTPDRGWRRAHLP